ncbi:NAD+ synthase [Candidatus Woesearchaeota archaeon]|nr:NAD+ synthase [Candidatus Woesearchaeota archaeon]
MQTKLPGGQITKSLKQYCRKHNITKAVLGVSGGIDSALCAAIAVKALGPQNVTALLLPEKGVTKKQNVEDALQLCKQLKINYILQPINPILNTYLKNSAFPLNNLAKINLKARIRATILYSCANTNNAIVIGTGNKTELTLGYFTKYGDGAVDILPIGNLYKQQVKEIASFLKVPQQIIDKKPTAELYREQTDEQELGMSYEELDHRLQTNKLTTEIKQIIKKNLHKTKPIPIL